MKEARAILVVEDSDEDFTVLLWAFKGAGIANTVERCTTAAATLDFLAGDSRSSANPPVCLVILDLNLPDASGTELLQRVRQAYPHGLPVIVYSTASRGETVIECYKAGATSYVVKPLGLTAVENFAAALRAWWLETVLPMPD